MGLNRRLLIRPFFVLQNNDGQHYDPKKKNTYVNALPDTNPGRSLIVALSVFLRQAFGVAFCSRSVSGDQYAILSFAQSWDF